MTKTDAIDVQRLKRLALSSLVTATGITTLSNSTIGNWLAAGLPRNTDGTLNIIAVVAWLAKERRSKEPSKAKARTVRDEYYTVRTEAARLDLEDRRRNLIDRRLVVDQWSQAAAVLKRQLESVCRKFPEAADAIHVAIAQTKKSTRLDKDRE